MQRGGKFRTPSLCIREGWGGFLLLIKHENNPLLPSFMQKEGTGLDFSLFSLLLIMSCPSILNPNSPLYHKQSTAHLSPPFA
jgi:hypothetical protein